MFAICSNRMNWNHPTRQETPVPSHLHNIGINRRELLQVGYSGLLGFGLSSLLGKPVAAGEPRRTAKSVIIVFLTGAPATSIRSIRNRTRRRRFAASFGPSRLRYRV